jgi:hypothetical protein
MLLWSHLGKTAIVGHPHLPFYLKNKNKNNDAPRSNFPYIVMK